MMDFLRKQSRWIAGIIVAFFLITMLIPIVEMVVRGGNGGSP